MEFNEQIQSDEIVPESYMGHTPLHCRTNVLTLTAEDQVFLTENLVMVAQLKDGKLVRASGFVAKVEQLEMDTVRITRNGVSAYFVLGEQIQWLPEKEVQ